MRIIEKLRKEYQSYEKWYYHLTLDSLGERNLLNNQSQCVNAMNTIAIGQFLYGIGVVQFDWMRNHGHLILYATGFQCCQLFGFIRFRANLWLAKDGFPPLPKDWFMKLGRLGSPQELVNAVTYSARNSYDARSDILPGGYLWSSNYLIFSDIGRLFEYRLISDLGPTESRRLLMSRVSLPGEYKVCKLGYVLPESYLLRTTDQSLTKAQSLYLDSKDYTYKLFRDYNTYKKVAAEAGEIWSPSGKDIDNLIDSILTFGFGVNSIRELSMDRRCDLAAQLTSSYGIKAETVAEKLNLSRSAVNKMSYSYSKNRQELNPALGST